jgi:hypothetical protein
MSRPLTILLTGFTSRQANTVSEKSNIYATTSPLFAGMLRQLGHTVDWRPTIVGEAGVENYDIVMVGCSNPNSMTGMVHRYGAMYAMLKARRLLIWYDDWRVKEQYSAWINAPDSAWATRMLHEKRLGEHAQAMEHKPAIDAMLKALTTTDKAPVLAQLFNWGNEKLFMKEVPEAKWLARFDISAFTPVHVTDPKSVVDRSRSWVSAALSQTEDYTDKLRLTWPLLNQTKPKGKGFGGWKKMREDAIVKVLYRDNIGVLCKPYSHAGSGWWRSRYSYAVQCRNVMLADYKEIHGLGGPYLKRAAEIEAMDAGQLEQLIDQQVACFTSFQDSQSLALTRLSGHLTRIMDEPARPVFA